MATTQSEQQALDLDRYRALLLRHKWVILFAAIPVLIAGLLFCLITPKVYRTSTTIVVIPQRVPEAYIRSTVTGDAEERVRGIWQEITSRTNLERVIQLFNLYQGAREGLPMETVVGMMRERIQIDSPRSPRTNAFILTYEGKDPVQIAKVTNALANMFIEENLKLRESQASGTADFLAKELDKVSRELRELEESLKQYTIAHMGGLPEQRETNLAMLQRLQQQMETLQESIRRAEDRKLLLQRQLAEEETTFRTAAASGDGGPAGGATVIQTPTTLGGLYKRLRALRTRYTEEHPDVVAVKGLIAKLEAEQPEAPVPGGEETESADEQAPSREGRGGTENAMIIGLSYQLKSLNLEIKSLKSESAKVRQQTALYQTRIEDTPKREQELTELTRDYDNLRRTYESLLNRKIEAEQAAAMERRQQGEQFRVVDPARIPETPYKPNLRKILAMTFMLAAGAGVGLAFVLEFLSKVFFDPKEVSKALGLPVVACLPLLLTAAEKRRKELTTWLLGATACLGYGVVASLLLVLWRKGAGAWIGAF